MRAVNKITKYTRKTRSILREEGGVSLAIKTLEKIKKKQIDKTTNPNRKIKFQSLVDRESVMAADWVSNKYQSVSLATKPKPPYTFNWVMSPPAGGGGHQNIFRFIEFLDSKGHKNNIYLYSTTDETTPDQARANVSAYCKAENLTFQRLGKKMAQADMIFATGWETAYPVFNEITTAKKMYFVQDFEPYFYAIGTDYILAENTYKFGFHAITAGGYLNHKLSTEYGMKCENYEFAADEKTYKYTNEKTRREIFFYARPVTERRGFDLGIMVLELFHKKHPEYTINLAGWDVSGYDIPFPYVNHKALDISQLPALYNKCAAALVISLTNMSLLPPELLACGTIPVVNEGPNNRLVTDNPFIAYVEASPARMAEELSSIVTDKNLIEKSKNASKSINRGGWAASKKKFLDVITKELQS
ncbi:glycosyltransferase family 1 protein [Candidatus Nomurabacteria bacterium]|nr:glycosyltransferase family 1 protein [Candidatus Nomurabacteria bacterium]